MSGDKYSGVRTGISLAVYLVIGVIAVGVVMSGSAAVHCEEPVAEHAASVEWSTGGSSADEAKTVTTATNVSLDGSDNRWFRMYVEDGQAIVPDHFCITSGTHVTVYEESDGERHRHRGSGHGR